MSQDHLLQAEIRGSTSVHLEGWLWNLAALLDDTADAPSRAYLSCQIEDVRKELARRERIADPVQSLRMSSAQFDLERIKADVTLIEAMPRMAGVDLRKSGNRWAARCPFPDHRDGSPSLSVRGDGMVWNCFGCGRGGDLFSFAQEWYAARSFRASVEFVLAAMGLNADGYLRHGAPQRSTFRVA